VLGPRRGVRLPERKALEGVREAASAVITTFSFVSVFASDIPSSKFSIYNTIQFLYLSYVFGGGL
jgi:hypothetical protein